MQKIIDAEKSDLFDVLAYVAYALPPMSREERAARAKVAINTRFNTKQQGFLDFVLAHYVGVGVDELDQEKLTPLLHLKYRNSIADLGRPEEISKVFVGFKSICTSRSLNRKSRVRKVRRYGNCGITSGLAESRDVRKSFSAQWSNTQRNAMDGSLRMHFCWS